MSKFEEYQKQEKKVGEEMAKYQQATMELTGLDTRGGQLGPIEIYKVARKAAMDVLKEMKEKESGIIV